MMLVMPIINKFFSLQLTFVCASISHRVHCCDAIMLYFLSDGDEVPVDVVAKMGESLENERSSWRLVEVQSTPTRENG